MTTEEKETSSATPPKEENIAEDTPDYNAIREESLNEEMSDIWQEDMTLFENISLAISSSVLLPDYAIQNPILSAFIILPQPVLELSPNTWIQGPSGSGKSQPLAVARFLYRYPVPFGTSTPVGLRNIIYKHRFSKYHPSMPEKQWKEKHFLLLVDNATYNFFSDKDMQGLFLQGINRYSDKWVTAGEKAGTTILYHTFCRKMASSCFPINDKEVQRRCLLIQCEKSEDELVAHLIDLTLVDFDWSGHLNSYWNRDNLVEFKNLWKAYPKEEFKGEKNRINYYKDIHSVLLMNGYDKPIELINEFENRKVMFTQNSSLFQMLELFIKQLKFPDSISNRILQQYIVSRIKSDDIERPSGSDIKEAMHFLGYSEFWDQTGSSWVK